jgi:hypothetical protein
MIGRKRRASVGTYVEPPLVPLAPIERVVDEGAIIYLSAARMSVKNRIIVAALGKHLDYEPAVLRDAVREELGRLADDNDVTAARLESTPEAAAHPESVMDDDLVAQKREDQRRRPRVHRLIAEVLREHARSEERLQAIVDQARGNAVDEMFLAIDSRLSTGAVVADADYESSREQRLADFVKFDLLGQEPEPEPKAGRRAKRAR